MVEQMVVETVQKMWSKLRGQQKPEECELDQKVRFLALEDKPITKLSDVVGLDHAKDLLGKAIITPIKS